MLVNLVNRGCNPFLERLASFIKKSKQYNWSNTTSDNETLMLILCINGPLNIGLMHVSRNYNRTSLL